MAKTTKPVEEKSARQARWDAYVQAYAISNPVKYAKKIATESETIVDGRVVVVAKKNEFAEIPASFV